MIETQLVKILQQTNQEIKNRNLHDRPSCLEQNFRRGTPDANLNDAGFDEEAMLHRIPICQVLRRQLHGRGFCFAGL